MIAMSNIISLLLICILIEKKAVYLSIMKGIVHLKDVLCM